MKTYTGLITELKPNQIFVFGSNTQGRHGKGVALTAKLKFGAIYGQSLGLQGQSYAIVTKDLTKLVHPSISKNDIKFQVLKLYAFALSTPNIDYLISYSVGQAITTKSLNGYTYDELAEMFAVHPIPDNIVFEETFAQLILKHSLQS